MDESFSDQVLLQSLVRLLERRLEVIADASLREADPAAHLARLQEVSEAITAFHREHRSRLDSQLNHYLVQSSLGKALDLAREGLSVR